MLKYGEVPEGDYKKCSIDDCIGVHRAKGMCMRHYNAWYQKGDPRKFRFSNSSGVCSVNECQKPCRSSGSIYCEMHYMRLRRSGSLDGALVNAARGAYVQTCGYIIECRHGHPLCRKGRRGVYQHRLVFYDANGSGPFRCHWCSKWVTWEKLHIDHRDDNVRNNDLSNLFASCGPCNRNRSGKSAKQSRLLKSPLLTLDGVSKTQAQWCRDLGITSTSMHWRIHVAKWPLSKALTQARGVTGSRRVVQTTMLDLWNQP